MFFVALLQLLLQALGTGPGVFPFIALRTSFGVCVGFPAHLTGIVKTMWAFPGSQLVSIARQFYFTLVNFSTMLRFALCIVARLTSPAFRIRAMWVETAFARRVSLMSIVPLRLCVFSFRKQLPAHFALPFSGTVEAADLSF